MRGRVRRPLLCKERTPRATAERTRSSSLNSAAIARRWCRCDSSPKTKDPEVGGRHLPHEPRHSHGYDLDVRLLKRDEARRVRQSGDRCRVAVRAEQRGLARQARHAAST